MRCFNNGAGNGNANINIDTQIAGDGQGSGIFSGITIHKKQRLLYHVL